MSESTKPKPQYNGREYEMLALSQIRVEDAFNLRKLGTDTVQQYTNIVAGDMADAELKAGADPHVMNYFTPTLPPVTVWRDADGTLRMSGGAHRFQGYKENNLVVIPAFIEYGGYKEAKWHALGDNVHGRPLAAADKRSAVLEVLDDVNWSAKSDREIARHIGCSHTFVAQLRSAFKAAFESGEYDAESVRKLTRMLNKHDRDVEDDLKAGKITPREAEDIYNRREKDREEKAVAREKSKREAVDKERLEQAQHGTDANPASDGTPLEDTPSTDAGGNVASPVQSDDEFMADIPAYAHLQKVKPRAAQRLRVDALHYRAIAETGLIGFLDDVVEQHLDGVMQGHSFCDALKRLAAIPHPQQWGLTPDEDDYSLLYKWSDLCLPEYDEADIVHDDEPQDDYGPDYEEEGQPEHD